MCTVSVYRDQNLLLVSANRDELRTRREAGLQRRTPAQIEQVYPLDAAANGTWIGANACGVSACLLNMYESDYQGVLSRGLIIPKLLGMQNLSAVRQWLNSAFNPALYSAFVLLVMDKSVLYRYRWDGQTLAEELVEFDRWFLESSSSVDLHPTLRHRRQLFQKWQQQDGDPQNILDFHLLRDEENASQSVCMAREKSHTKSISQVVVTSNRIEFRYLEPAKLESFVNRRIQPKDLQQAHVESVVQHCQAKMLKQA